MPARTLVVSQRNLDRAVFHAWKYELEDVLQKVDEVDLFAPSAARRAPLVEFGRRAENGVRRRLKMRPSIQIDRWPVPRSYESLFVVCSFPEELAILEKMDGWRARAKTAVCFIGDVWPDRLDSIKKMAPLLRQFDHVFLHVVASVEPVANLIRRPCHGLVTGIDALRFCPYPGVPARTVDCYSYGRRSAATHQALLDLSRRTNFFYIHDTANAFSVIDPAEHRGAVANIARRSRYVISYKHNVNLGDVTGGTEALGPRFFEATAAGAVVLGIAPECPEFHEYLGWEDSVIPIPYDGRDIEEIFRALDAQPSRLERVRVNNVLGALETNDWAHRLRRIFEISGLAQPTRLAGRIECLRARTEGIRRSLPGAAAADGSFPR